VHARTGLRDFGVASEVLYDLLGPLLEFSRLRVAALVEVNAGKRIPTREDKAYAVVTAGLEGFDGLLE